MPLCCLTTGNKYDTNHSIFPPVFVSIFRGRAHLVFRQQRVIAQEVRQENLLMALHIRFRLRLPMPHKLLLLPLLFSFLLFYS